MSIHRTIALLSLALIIGVGNARSETEEDTRPMFGIKVAFDVNIPGKWHNDNGSVKMYNHGYGFTLGGVYNVYLGKGFYIEPGVSLFYDRYSFDDLHIINNDGTIVDNNPTVYKIGLRVPVTVGYVFTLTDRFSMSVYTGPELNYSFAGKYIVKHKDSINTDFPSNPFDGQRRVDCAWRIGLGFPINSFLIGIDASIGMTNLLKNPDISFRENRATVGVTYYF